MLRVCFLRVSHPLILYNGINEMIEKKWTPIEWLSKLLYQHSESFIFRFLFAGFEKEEERRNDCLIDVLFTKCRKKKSKIITLYQIPPQPEKSDNINSVLFIYYLIIANSNEYNKKASKKSESMIFQSNERKKNWAIRPLNKPTVNINPSNVITEVIKFKYLIYLQ